MHNALTIGQYLLKAIREIGIEQVFGIPGDLIIGFFKQIEEDPNLKLYTFSHEPAVGFAAIGSARAKQKPAVACVTYGPGALSLINTVACAYAEKVPLIVIAGSPPVNLRKSDYLLHHNLKGYNSQHKIFNEVTAEAIVLDDQNVAAAQIQKALAVCQGAMLPVYIELPVDIVNSAIKEPMEKPCWQSPVKSQLWEASSELTVGLARAQKPVFILGIEAVRFGLVSPILNLAVKLNVPVVSTMLSRDYIPKGDNFFGVYLGKAGNPNAEELVATSDFLLLLGEDVTDVTLNNKFNYSKTALIYRCVSGQMKTQSHTYNGVPLKDLVSKLLEAQILKKQFTNKETLLVNQKVEQNQTRLTTDNIISIINRFFAKHGGLPVISDTGDFLFASLKIETQSVIGSSFYGTMGFAAPAAIGYMLTTKKRPLVLIGDGAFQMTGQEISHCPRYGINPIFIVNNNQSWGMEQLFHSSSINQLSVWHYAEMANLWGGKGYLCKTQKKLWAALEDAKNLKAFSLIEAVTDGSKPSSSLKAYVEEQRQQK